MSFYSFGKTQSLTPTLIVFEEDNNSFSKIGNVNSPPFFVSKSLYICSMDKQLIVNMDPIHFYQECWCIFEHSWEGNFNSKFWHLNVIHSVYITAGIFIIDYIINILDNRDHSFPVMGKTWQNYLKIELRFVMFLIGIWINDFEGWCVADSYRSGLKLEAADMNWII